MTKMSNMKTLAVCVMIMAAGIGCKPPSAPPAKPAAKDADKTGAAKSSAKKHDHDHDHKHDHEHGEGPNGGVVFDLGAHHAEFTVDHAAKQCVVLFIEGDDKDAAPLAVEASELTLTTKETRTKDGKALAAMTITLKPADAKDGKASKFIGADPGLETEAELAGSVIGEVDGKPAQGEFKE